MTLQKNNTIINNSIKNYLDELCPGNSDIIEKVRKEAIASKIPIIRRDVESFLKMQLAVIKPERILEIGTATGYSSIIIASASSENTKIVTLEIGENDYRKAQENIAVCGFSEKIECILCDASEYLSKMDIKFDMIFLDAAKGQYINWLPDIMRILKNGGILIADNILLDGSIVEREEEIERRDRTSYRRMKEFLSEISSSKDLITSLLTIGDGLSVSVKK